MHTSEMEKEKDNSVRINCILFIQMWYIWPFPFVNGVFLSNLNKFILFAICVNVFMKREFVSLNVKMYVPPRLTVSASTARKLPRNNSGHFRFKFFIRNSSLRSIVMPFSLFLNSRIRLFVYPKWKIGRHFSGLRQAAVIWWQTKSMLSVVVQGNSFHLTRLKLLAFREYHPNDKDK